MLSNFYFILTKRENSQKKKFRKREHELKIIFFLINIFQILIFNRSFSSLKQFYYLFSGLELPINTHDCIELKTEFRVSKKTHCFFLSLPRINFRLGCVNGKIGLMNDLKEMNQELFSPNVAEVLRISFKIKFRGFANISKSNIKKYLLIFRKTSLFNSNAYSTRK